MLINNHILWWCWKCMTREGKYRAGYGIREVLGIQTHAGWITIYILGLSPAFGAEENLYEEYVFIYIIYIYIYIYTMYDTESNWANVLDIGCSEWDTLSPDDARSSSVKVTAVQVGIRPNPVRVNFHIIQHWLTSLSVSPLELAWNLSRILCLLLCVWSYACVSMFKDFGTLNLPLVYNKVNIIPIK